MQLFIFILLALVAWFACFVKFQKADNLGFYLNNISIVLIFDIVILGTAYLISTFKCDNQLCSDSYMAIGILVASVFAFVWAIMLFFKSSVKK